MYFYITNLQVLVKYLKKKFITGSIGMFKDFKLLSPNQLGFRKFHSTTDCHVKIETEILESYANKQTMILISLDLQKAYDTVWRHKVLNILSKWHINGKMLQFM